MFEQTVDILLVEDDRVQARRLLALLTDMRDPEVRVAHCSDLDGALGFLLARRPLDLILTDLHLPDSFGLETFHALHSAAPSVPVVVLTGCDDLNVALTAIREGAQDYLVKSELSRELLVRAVRYAIERKQVAESLRLSEEKYRQLFENVADAVLTFEPDSTRILDVNPAGVELFGYARDELLRLRIKDLICKTGTSRRLVRKLLANAQTPRHGTVRRFLKRGGSSFPAEMFATQVCSPDGTPLVIATIRDLSRITHFKLALELSQESFRNIVQKHADGIVVTDPAACVLFANPAAEFFLRGNLETTVGTRLELPVHPGAEAELSILRLDGQAGIGELRCVGTAWQGNEARLVSIRDITERKQMEEQILHDALHDGLTGLSNRNLFLNRLSHVLNLAHRTADPFAVLLVDIDRFKYVNDGLGHVAGNELLTACAQRLQECLREEDTLARLGSDEFAVLLESLQDSREPLYLAMRMQEALKAPFVLAGQDVFITVSIGICLGPTAYERPEHVLRDANTAMHRAKEVCKSGYVVFDEEMHERAIHLLRLESNLRRAVELGELELHYQPIIELEQGRLQGFEALLRWRQPEQGLVAPADFIDFAEQTGLILEIGWWVFEQASMQLQRWRQALPEADDLTISINLSPRQLRQPRLVERMGELLARIELPAGLLVLEITENALIEDGDAAVRLLQDLKHHGFRIALDDFGTGYSSLSYLHRFPVDQVKIDRSFVAQMGEAGHHDEIVKAILSLAHILGLGVTAEGVETAEQLGLLRVLGCECAQGFLIGRPAGAEEAAQLIVGDRRWTSVT